jgi:hypothetical protein
MHHGHRMTSPPIRARFAFPNVPREWLREKGKSF